MQNWLENWTNAKFCDVANLILGAILFVSPWIFGFDAGRSLKTPISPVSPSRSLRSRRWRHSRCGRSG